MFDVDTFIADCRTAITEAQPALAIRDVVGRAVSASTDVAEVLRPERAGIERIHVADDLTVIKVVWAPGMSLYPHDHRMWAVIGIYAGREDNAFYRRSSHGLLGSGGKQLDERDVVVLGDQTIHGVTNPLPRHTGAIHVYGGDFFTQPRSEWDPVTLEERPYEVARALAQFEEANRRWEDEQRLAGPPG